MGQGCRQTSLWVSGEACEPHSEARLGLGGSRRSVTSQAARSGSAADVRMPRPPGPGGGVLRSARLGRSETAVAWRRDRRPSQFRLSHAVLSGTKSGAWRSQTCVWHLRQLGLYWGVSPSRPPPPRNPRCCSYKTQKRRRYESNLCPKVVQEASHTWLICNSPPEGAVFRRNSAPPTATKSESPPHQGPH